MERPTNRIKEVGQMAGCEYCYNRYDRSCHLYCKKYQDCLGFYQIGRRMFDDDKVVIPKKRHEAMVARIKYLEENSEEEANDLLKEVKDYLLAEQEYRAVKKIAIYMERRQKYLYRLRGGQSALVQHEQRNSKGRRI